MSIHSCVMSFGGETDSSIKTERREKVVKMSLCFTRPSCYSIRSNVVDSKERERERETYTHRKREIESHLQSVIQIEKE